MTAVQFWCVDQGDLACTLRFASALAEKGARVSFVSGYLGVPEVARFDGFPSHRAPRLLRTRLRIRRLAQERAFTRTHTGDREGIASTPDWLTTLPRFLESHARKSRPDCVVLTPPDVEPSIASDVCDRAGIRYACVVPPFYEFKYDAYLSAYPNAAAYFVAGAFGQARLVELGVPRERAVIVGAPAITVSRSSSDRARRKPTIVYTSQGFTDNVRLFARLLAYLAKRPEVELRMRPHPGARGGRGEETHAFAELRDRSPARARVTIDAARSLLEDMVASSVMVTITSNTLLDALAMGLPTIRWAPECGPTRMPFDNDDGVDVARDADELERFLDAALFAPEAREGRAKRCRAAHARYVSEYAPEPFVDTVLGPC